MREETGITDLEILDYIGEVPGAKEGDRVPLFLCRTDQDVRLMEPDKFSEWQWVNLNSFPENYINNQAREIITRFLSNSSKDISD